MDKENIYFSKESANPSGAPEAGGATTPHSSFGGQSLLARVLRLVARLARNVEASAYRRLRELEAQQPTHGPGSPHRTKEAEHREPGTFSDDARISPV